ncbi:SDR family NAD(P)-dependent oxidoreductase [Gluconobacter morbifer]|uniref:Putative oxidoreductase n=1 Tax=Gluconobacter morbifer G707 TaxID=1088869 RepID=G6XF15_9PROT|nr:SDR family NAD(P)-dependent oxidoreductase [Gluconobacter morbifer]EHH68773.1 putative oxidoreductase [Gluconobacter morbifer G707]
MVGIDLSGRTALVTGSTGGIGLAIAKGLASAGATVIINGRSQDTVEKALATLGKTVPGGSFRSIVADVGTAEGCKTVIETENSVDILINNAGIFKPNNFFQTSDADWQSLFDVNLFSGVRLSRAYLPGMKDRNWGRVVFISSESALNIPVEMVDYGVSKTAMLGLSRGLAKLMAHTNVTVNAILPGFTLSEGVEDMLKAQNPGDSRSVEDLATEFVRKHRPSDILGRAATVDEVANLVVYTASPLASATTGAALRVDGGTVDTIA